METKSALQSQLKAKYGINKNMSATLNRDECEVMLEQLDQNPAVAKLVAAYVEKNNALRKSNATLNATARTSISLDRNPAETTDPKTTDPKITDPNLPAKYDQLNAEYDQLETEYNELATDYNLLATEYNELNALIAALDSTNQALSASKKQLESDRQAFTTDIRRIIAEHSALNQTVTELRLRTDELTNANTQLKKDNKDLKNTVDAIRLRLAQDVRQLLSYEDSSIRPALITLFNATLG